MAYICSKIRKIPSVPIPYRHAHTAFSLLALILLIASCNPTRRLGEDEYLLDRNHVKVDGELRFDKDQVKPVIKQKPNKRILFFFRFHLGVHNMANNGNDSSKVRNWLMEDVGEAPVVHDSNETVRSAEQLRTFLTKRGYFRSKVKDSVVRIDEERFLFNLIRYKKKRAESYYLLEPGPLFHFGEISYDLEKGLDEKGRKVAKENSLLKEGDPFDIDKLDEERGRISQELREKGYFTFDRNAIHFNLDSSVGDHKVKVEMEIKPEARRSEGDRDSVIRTEHRPWKVRKLLVRTDHDPTRDENETEMDTLRWAEGYRFIHPGELRIDPELLVQSIHIKPNEAYNAENDRITYRRLSELKIFHSANISYERIEEGVIDCEIRLSRTKTQSLSLETRGTNRGGNLGVSGNINYRNRNIFRGAETFGVDLTGGVESQRVLTDEGGEEDRNVVSGLELNTVEFGPELSLDFPKFLLPASPTRFSRSNDPHTRLSASMNFQQRPDYTRDMANMSMSYRWDETKMKKHRVNPIDLSMIRIDKTEEFERRLREFNDQLLLNSYDNHLIFGSQYGYTYNDQTDSEQDHVNFFKGNFEASGNSLKLIHDLSGAETSEDGRYRIAGVGFAQFLKGDVDYRHYLTLNEKNNFAFRLYGGIGVPYGNSDALPFQRSFFSGGANGIRAWRIRTLGPGSYTDSSFALSFDRIGDIKLEGNAEYRFDLLQPIEGALFVDAGNIWLLDLNERRPGGAFKSDEFYKEIAVGGGFGVRVDLDFFIIRLDLGVPLKDPELPEGERWIFQPKDRINAAREEISQDMERNLSPYRPQLNLNLGIGYPF